MKLSYPKFWQQRNWLACLLLPAAGVFYLISLIRKFCYKIGFFKSVKFTVPIIVVGNITVGGTGKTPLVIWLAKYFQQQGKIPGIISRGYGGRSKNYPCQVRIDSDYREVGDEALIIVRHTKCPMVVAPNRVAAVEKLLAVAPECNVIISDDGLQHYALKRDREIILVDGLRLFGNGFLMPAGPLREPKNRLMTKQAITIINGIDVDIAFDAKAISVGSNGLSKNLTAFTGQKIHAVAGIGNPERFFSMLEKEGMILIRHSFPDHHVFTEQDLNFNDELPIIMTEKDAVKCEKLVLKNAWYIPVTARVKMEKFTNRFITI